jgi:hypothetical protein
VVSQKCVAEQPQVPFDFAQGRLSTAIGAKYAPISAQDDTLFIEANYRVRTLAFRKVCGRFQRLLRPAIS